MEARDNELGARERRGHVLVRELRDQVTEAGGVREVRGVGVGELGFFSFVVTKEGEKLVVAGFQTRNFNNEIILIKAIKFYKI